MKSFPITSLVIHSFMLEELNLNLKEAAVYSIIYNTTCDGNTWYEGGISSFCNRIKLSKKTIIGIINSLVEKKLVEKSKTICCLEDNRKIIMKLRALDVPIIQSTLNDDGSIREINRITTRKTLEPKSVIETNLEHLKTKCKYSEIADEIMLFANKYYEFMSYYTNSKHVYINSDAMKTIVDNLESIESYYLEEEYIEEVLDYYIQDYEKHLSMGYTPSLSHLTNMNFLEVYLERIR